MVDYDALIRSVEKPEEDTFDYDAIIGSVEEPSEVDYDAIVSGIDEPKTKEPFSVGRIASQLGRSALQGVADITRFERSLQETRQPEKDISIQKVKGKDQLKLPTAYFGAFGRVKARTSDFDSLPIERQRELVVAEAKKTEEESAKFSTEVIAQYPEVLPGTSGKIESALVGAGRFLPTMAVSGVAPPIGLAMTFETIAGSKYDQLRDKGVDKKRAASTAILDSLAQTPIEFLGNIFQIGKIAQLANKLKLPGMAAKIQSFVTTVGMNAGAEGLEELLQNYPDAFADIYAENPDMSAQEMFDKYIENIGSITKSGLEQAELGAIGSLLLSGGGASVQAAEAGGRALLGGPQAEQERFALDPVSEKVLTAFESGDIEIADVGEASLSPEIQGTIAQEELVSEFVFEAENMPIEELTLLKKDPRIKGTELDTMLDDVFKMRKEAIVEAAKSGEVAPDVISEEEVTEPTLPPTEEVAPEITAPTEAEAVQREVIPAAEEVLPAREKSVPGLSGVTLEDVQQFTKGLESGINEAGEIYVKSPVEGQDDLVIRNVTSLTPDRAAFEVARGALTKDQKMPDIAGSFTPGEIEISKTGKGDKWTLAHEHIHWLEDANIMDEGAQTFLTDEIKDLHSKGKLPEGMRSVFDELSEEAQQAPENKDLIGGAEDRANFISVMMENREAVKQYGTPVQKVMQKVFDFIDGLANIVTRTGKGVVRAVETGKVFGKVPKAKIQEKVETKEPKPQKAVKKKSAGKPTISAVREGTIKYSVASLRKEAKTFPTAEAFIKSKQREYAGEHEAPTRDSGAPGHNLSDMFPDDIYGPMGARHYGHGENVAMDEKSIAIMRSMKGKPNKKITIYRAVPKGLTPESQIEEIEKQKAYILKHGSMPPGIITVLDSSDYYEKISDEQDLLKKKIRGKDKKPVKTEKPPINPGDWVSINRAYVVDHGKRQLDNKYEIISKKVKASDIFTDANSIHEWGYDPKVGGLKSEEELREIWENSQAKKKPAKQKPKKKVKSKKKDKKPKTKPQYQVAPPTDSKAFKKWFGDSKVVDSKGEPLVVYHGTKDLFDIFKKIKLGSNTRHPSSIWGFAFTSDIEYAKGYSYIGKDNEIIKDVYLSVQNPKTISFEEYNSILEKKGGVVSFKDSVMQKGHDGIVVNPPVLDKSNPFYERYKLGFYEIFVFEPTQIKSATKNIGAFDPKDPRIQYQTARPQYTFVGPNAARRDPSLSPNLSNAMDMNRAGEEMDSIRKQTGWFQGEDSLWRFEVNDSNRSKRVDVANKRASDYSKKMRSKYGSTYLDKMTPAEKVNYTRQLNRLVNAGVVVDEGMMKKVKGGTRVFRGKLSDILVHNRLFDLYPSFKNINVDFAVNDRLRGSSNGTLAYKNGKWTIEYITSDMKQLKRGILHEVQHRVQYEEGFAVGGHSKAFDMERSMYESAKAIRSDNKLKKNVMAKLDAFIKNPVAENNMDLMFESVFDAGKKLNGLSTNFLDYMNFVHYPKLAQELSDALSMSPKEFGKKYDEATTAPFQRYLSLAGEVEARDVADRAFLSWQDVKEKAPAIMRGVTPNMILRTEQSDTVFSDQRYSLDRRPSYMGINGEIVSDKNGVKIVKDLDTEMYDVLRNDEWAYTSARVRGARDVAEKIETPRVPQYQVAKKGDKYQTKNSKEAEKVIKESFGATPRRLSDRIITSTERFKEWRTGIFDRLHPIKKHMGENRAYILHRGASGEQSVLNAFMEHGELRFDEDYTITTDTIGQGFVPWLKEKGSDGNKLFYWVAAKRAEALAIEDIKAGRKGKERREKFLTASKRKAIFEWVGEPEGDQSWEELNDEFQEFNNNILDIAQDAGLISKDNRAEWQQQFYVPFYRVFEDENTRAEFLASPKKGKQHLSAQIKRLKGSERKIGDPLSNVLSNWMHLVSESMQNVARREAYNYSQEADLKTPSRDEGGKLVPTVERASKADVLSFKQVGKDPKTIFISTKDNVPVLSFRDNGKPVFFKVNDPELFTALSLVKPRTLNPVMQAMFGGAKRWLTLGATITPAFRIRNMIRDTLHTSIISKSFTPVWSTMKGLKSAWVQDEDYVKFVASGHAFGGSYLKADDPKAVKKYINKLSKAEKRNILNPKRLYDKWQDIGDAAENAARVALYSNLKKQGVPHQKAAFAARDLMDFQMSGASDTVNFLVSTVPFLNARLQGLYKMGRAAKEDPKSVLLKGAMLSLASLSLVGVMAALGHDDDYEELEDWDKFTYYHFWIGDHHFRLPKPFEAGLVWSTFPEVMLNIARKKEEYNYILDFAKHAAMDTLAFNPIPQLFKPGFEQYYNTDFFTGREIEPEYMKRLAAHERYNIWTKPTFIALARAMKDIPGLKHLSPARMEAFVKGYFSNLASIGLAIPDYIIHHALDFPDKPTKRWDEMPTIRSFYKTEPPKNTKFRTRFYEIFDEIDKLVGTIEHYKKGTPQEYEEAKKLAFNNKEKIKFRKASTSVRSQLTQIGREIKNIQKSRTLSPEQKRERLDKLYVTRNEIVKRFYKAYKEATK